MGRSCRLRMPRLGRREGASMTEGKLTAAGSKTTQGKHLYVHVMPIAVHINVFSSQLPTAALPPSFGSGQCQDVRFLHERHSPLSSQLRTLLTMLLEASIRMPVACRHIILLTRLWLFLSQPGSLELKAPNS